MPRRPSLFAHVRSAHFRRTAECGRVRQQVTEFTQIPDVPPVRRGPGLKVTAAQQPAGQDADPGHALLARLAQPDDVPGLDPEVLLERLMQRRLFVLEARSPQPATFSGSG